MKPHVLMLTLTAVIAVLTSCGVIALGRGDMAENMRTLSEQQAVARVERHISDAVAAVPVKLRLEEGATVSPLPCDDPSDQGPLGRVTVANVYWLRELPIERTDELFQVMHSYWLSHDYRVLADHRDLRVPALFVESNRDAFRMSLQANVRGELSISATSPCVWPEGTPPPDVVPR